MRSASGCAAESAGSEERGKDLLTPVRHGPPCALENPLSPADVGRLRVGIATEALSYEGHSSWYRAACGVALWHRMFAHPRRVHAGNTPHRRRARCATASVHALARAARGAGA